MAADTTIMRDMGVGHEIIIISDLGEFILFDGPPIDGHELSEYVAASDFNPRRLLLIGDILWVSPYGRVGEKAILLPDLYFTIQVDMCIQACIFMDDNIRANDAERTDIDS